MVAGRLRQRRRDPRSRDRQPGRSLRWRIAPHPERPRGEQVRRAQPHRPGCSPGGATTSTRSRSARPRTTAYSRMTVVVDGDAALVEQITKQLNKLIPVIKISELAESDAVERELMLVTIKGDGRRRGRRSTELASIFEAKILDVGYEAMTLMVAGQPGQARRDDRAAQAVRHRRAAADGSDRAAEAEPPAQQAPGRQEPQRLSYRSARSPVVSHTSCTPERARRAPERVRGDESWPPRSRTTTVPTSDCSTARPSRSSGTARRVTPTR